MGREGDVGKKVMDEGLSSWSGMGDSCLAQPAARFGRE